MNIVKFIVTIMWLITSFIGSVYAGDNWKVDMLFTAPWGSEVGMFGKEQEGKTELGFALDMQVTTDAIYVLDAVNDRIQVFKINGQFEREIKLQSKWREFGLPFHFTLYQDCFYFLIGKPPYYSPMGIREIHQYSSDGKFIKSFGKEFIPKGQEEFYNTILSIENNGLLLAGIGGIKILAFDKNGTLVQRFQTSKPNEILQLEGINIDGNPFISKTINKLTTTLLINVKNRSQLKTVNGKYSYKDITGSWYRIKSKQELYNKNNMSIKTKITMLSANNKLREEVLIRDQIKGKVKINGAFDEIVRYDQNGDIFQLIGYEDGVVLRKIVHIP